MTTPLHLMPLPMALEVRRRRGLDVYRGGDTSLPFVGDALVEAYEEALDLIVYLDEALAQGEARTEVQHISALALQVADALGSMLRARSARRDMRPDPYPYTTEGPSPHRLGRVPKERQIQSDIAQ